MSSINLTIFIWITALLISTSTTGAFTALSPDLARRSSSLARPRITRFSNFVPAASSPSSSSFPSSNAGASDDKESRQSLSWDKVTDEWELDCYSRPVLVDGKKKLWEILVTDSSGSMRVCRALPSNKVNSREVRRVVEEIINGSDVKPCTIRFFRGAMFNMVCF
mmetsp:Transcript_27958/g.59622  ORF Transcript_27958/g.59622 Transcript_27958/m.59622 type:complete len:165 (-) Transcript_27958:832-1326(-)